MYSFKLIELENNYWEIRTLSGVIILEARQFSNELKAEEFCTNYLSSWSNSMYTIERFSGN